MVKEMGWWTDQTNWTFAWESFAKSINSTVHINLQEFHRAVLLILNMGALILDEENKFYWYTPIRKLRTSDSVSKKQTKWSSKRHHRRIGFYNIALWISICIWSLKISQLFAVICEFHQNDLKPFEAAQVSRRIHFTVLQSRAGVSFLYRDL